MNLENIQNVAHEACFSTNPTTKDHAQKIFMSFTFNLAIDHYSQILQNFSQTVLFVFLSYLNKKISKNKDTQQIAKTFTILKSNLQSWYGINGQIRRPKQAQNLKNYVINTYGMVLGTCMKYLFMDENLKHNLIEFFTIQNKCQFKLFLCKSFIDVVSTIDNQIEYVKYRQLIYSFQDLIIPIFIQELYPYFISITDNIKIQELSKMLPNLNDKQLNLHYEMFESHDKTLCQLVFSLLNQIINFKFNITIGEWDYETQLQNCTISFPEAVLSKIVSKEFLQAFYYMVQKMAFLNYTGPFSLISFECLKKILLSKTTHLNDQQRNNIINLHFVGINTLTKMNINSYKILTQIFQCTNKFIHSFQFTQMNRANINHLQFVHNIKQKILKVLQVIDLNNQNQLYHATCQLIFKISHQAVQMSQQKYVPFYQQLCRDVWRVFFDNYICKDHYIYGSSKIQKISSLQSILRQFFFHITKVGSMDMGFMFNVISSRLNEVFSSNNCLKITNFIFLVTQIMDESFYDRSLIYQATSQQDLQVLGGIIHKCLEFVNYRRQWNISYELMDVAILLFEQKLLTECLSNLTESDQSIMISSPTYKIINSYKKIQTPDQLFLLHYFNELIINIKGGNVEQIEHILQAMHSLILKIKWALKRQIFTQSVIANSIKDVCIELSCNYMDNGQLLKERRKLFKIITILSFDDILDSYKLNIDYVIQSIQQSFNHHYYEKITFDMSGICQNIDTALIYKYFLMKIDQKIGIQNLFRQLYQSFQDKINLLQQVLYLNHSIISNKGQRMSHKSLSIMTYSIIDVSLTYITDILMKCNDQVYSQLLKQLYAMVNTILEASYINLYLVKRKSQFKFTNFMNSLIENILNNYAWVAYFPQLSKNMHETINFLLTRCSQIIISSQFTNENSILFINYVKLINSSVQISQKFLQDISQGSRQNLRCQQLLQSLSKLFAFMRYKKAYLHKNCLIQNITRIINQNSIIYQNFMLNLYKYGISNIKSFSNLLSNICINIKQLSYFYMNSYRSILISIGISGAKMERIQQIYKPLLEQKDSSLFIVSLREWFVNQEKPEKEEIQY